jgi:hypothetical protein
VRDEDVLYDDDEPQNNSGLEGEEDDSVGETAAEKRLRIGKVSRKFRSYCSIYVVVDRV